MKNKGKIDIISSLLFLLFILVPQMTIAANLEPKQIVDIKTKQIKVVRVYDGKQWLVDNRAPATNNLILWLQVVDLAKIKKATATLKLGVSKSLKTVELSAWVKRNWLKVELGKQPPGTHLEYAVCVFYELPDGQEVEECSEHFVDVAPSQIKKIKLQEGRSNLAHSTVKADSENLVLWVEVQDANSVVRLFARLKNSAETKGDETKDLDFAHFRKGNWYQLSLKDFSFESGEELNYKICVQYRFPGREQEIEEWSDKEGQGHDIHIIPTLDEFVHTAFDFNVLAEPTPFQKGIENIGNSCYLNSLVALAANFNVFDHGLNHAVLNRFNQPTDKEKRQAYLASLIQRARTFPAMQNLVSKKNIRPYAYFIGHQWKQQDPIEDILVAHEIEPNSPISLVRTIIRNYDSDIPRGLREILDNEIHTSKRESAPWMSLRPIKNATISNLIAAQYFKAEEEYDGGFVTKTSLSLSNNEPGNPAEFVLVKIDRFNAHWDAQQQAMQIEKNTDAIILEEDLHLPFDDEVIPYELVGSIHHSGKRIQSGHYYAHVKHDDSNWREHNDSAVDVVLYDDFRQDASSVLLLYRKLSK